MLKRYKYHILASAMREKCESPNDLANYLGISGMSVRRKLDDKMEWTISEIEKICEHYNKDFYELFKKEN